MARILIVDESPVDQRLIEGLLREDGQYELVLAGGAEEALREIASRPPDLVIADLNEPQIEGLKFVRGLGEQFPTIPVVLTTGRGTEELAVEALEHGAAGYIPGSRLAEELCSICERVLATAEDRRLDQRLMLGLVTWSSTFELGTDPALFRSLVRRIHAQLDELGFGEESTRTGLCLALEEAINNAHEHGNLELDSELREQDFGEYIAQRESRGATAPYHGRRIRVETRLSSEEVHFVVEDEGAGFDPATLPDPRDPENLERAAGRGILLMRTFMDEVSFIAPGNRVEMWCRADRSQDTDQSSREKETRT